MPCPGSSAGSCPASRAADLRRLSAALLLQLVAAALSLLSLLLSADPLQLMPPHCCRFICCSCPRYCLRCCCRCRFSFLPASLVPGAPVVCLPVLPCPCPCRAALFIGCRILWPGLVSNTPGPVYFPGAPLFIDCGSLWGCCRRCGLFCPLVDKYPGGIVCGALRSNMAAVLSAADLRQLVPAVTNSPGRFIVPGPCFLCWWPLNIICCRLSLLHQL